VVAEEDEAEYGACEAEEGNEFVESAHDYSLAYERGVV
jgi:hypothetical protein